MNETIIKHKYKPGDTAYIIHNNKIKKIIIYSLNITWVNSHITCSEGENLLHLEDKFIQLEQAISKWKFKPSIKFNNSECIACTYKAITASSEIDGEHYTNLHESDIYETVDEVIESIKPLL